MLKRPRSKTVKRARCRRARENEQLTIGLAAYRKAQAAGLENRPTTADKKKAAKERRAARFTWNGPVAKKTGRKMPVETTGAI